MKAIQQIDHLDHLMRKSINLDFPERLCDYQKEYSQYDKIYMQKVSDSIKLVDGHFSVGLPSSYLATDHLFSNVFLV